MTAAAVKAKMEAAGLEVVASCDFSIIGRSSRAMVHALKYPRGWRLQNAREARAATKLLMAKRPADVARFCSDLLRAGAR